MIQISVFQSLTVGRMGMIVSPWSVVAAAAAWGWYVSAWGAPSRTSPPSHVVAFPHPSPRNSATTATPRLDPLNPRTGLQLQPQPMELGSPSSRLYTSWVLAPNCTPTPGGARTTGIGAQGVSRLMPEPHSKRKENPKSARIGPRVPPNMTREHLS